MTKYAVTAFRFYKEFLTEGEARTYFEEIKNDFTYCELKRIRETILGYYATSLEIFRK